MEQENHTRKNKFEKRRKNTKFISILMIVSVILLILLIGIWLFGGDSNDEKTDEISDEKVQDQSDNTDETSMEDTDEEAATEIDIVDDTEEEDTTENDEEDNNSNNEDVIIEEAEPSDDNVSEAYTGNWEPVGTEQEGPHTINYDSNSQDRLEMTKAILLATGLNEEDYREWWIGRGGEQKVVATVSDSAETEVYRVYLSWKDNEGWQPTKVEVLFENDWEKYK
ncbi:YrrS family protein [Oceanobacillus halophilus]|uniref:DUF1510 family protein n=1 Tax=Oceanobacillus halophilus TaxID=930130 RepID=A0A495AEM8_9BACI|nr:YrrS family protein [Oceanobacillus halophilus]RKQ37864.1 DUF1510 family protein [Oceanobacillus halophilus]